MAITIYGLIDPRTDILRYVGQTKSPKKRYWRHCHPAKNQRTHRDNWIRSLLGQGLTPTFIELARAPTRDEANTAESFWISSLRASGGLLLNLEDGGKREDHQRTFRSETVE
jgi:hypothetical protein